MGSQSLCLEKPKKQRQQKQPLNGLQKAEREIYFCSREEGVERRGKEGLDTERRLEPGAGDRRLGLGQDTSSSS